MKTLRIYKKANGEEPFIEWLEGLKDKVIKARIKRRIDRLYLGHYGDCKSVGDGVHELRLKFGPGYRIYFYVHENEIILLLYGGDKSTQSKDIKKAKQYSHDFRERING